MRKNIKCRLFVFSAIFMLVGIVKPSYAAKVSFYGILGTSQLSITSQTTTGSTAGLLGVGGGTNFEFTIFKKLSLESGLLYFRRRINDDSINIEDNNIQVPLIFRLWLGKRFSIGAGGFLNYGFGDLNTSVGEKSFSDFGWKRYDAGYLAVVGYNQPLGRSMSLFLDVQYKADILDASSVSSTQSHWRDII